MKTRHLLKGRALSAALFALLLSVVGATNALAQDFTVGDLNYTVNYYDEASVTVTGHVDGQNATGPLEIPETVTYEGMSYSVTEIGYFAFQNCTGLTSVIIPNSVIVIGDFAFSGCSSIDWVFIPNSVMWMGINPFGDCSALTYIMVDYENMYFDSRDNCNAIIETSTNNLVTGCQNTYIPNSVSSIGESAFSQCTGLNFLTIPNSVTSIGMYAFFGCPLKYITVEEGNTVYDSRENCNAIIETSTNELLVGSSNAFIPNSVTSIGENAFYGCIGLTSVTIPNSVTSINSGAFRRCSGLISLTIGNSVEVIGSDAFDDCPNISYITVLAENPPALAEYGNTFGSLSTDTPIYVPCGFEDAYASYSWGGFSNFHGLCGGTVTVSADPEEGGMVSGGGIFEAGQTCTVTATPVDGYTVYWTINGIFVSYSAEFTFYVDSDMTIVAHFVPDANIFFADPNVKSICVANWDTNNDGELSYVEAASVKSLGEVFRLNEEIVSFNELQYFIGLTSIGLNTSSNVYCSFDGCSGLTSIILPNSLNSINDYAFYGCSGLTSMSTIPNTVNSIGQWAFYNCSSLTGTFVIPNSVISIGKGVFSGCSGIASLTIGNSVVSIGEEAFIGCTGLNSVYYTGNTYQWCRLFFGSNPWTNPLCYAHNLYIDNELVTDLIIPEDITRIKEFAFHGASCLTSLTISNSVTSIGQWAFMGCSGLTTMNVYAETPPALASPYTNNTSVFGNVNKSIPVYIPFGTTSAYQAAPGWSEFTNFIEMEAVNHYIPQGAAYSETMALYSVIQIDGEEQYSNTLEVGVFCGDECRGSAIASEFSLTHRYLAILNVFGENGHELTFKLYDHSTGQELELNSPAALTFDVDGYGNPIDPYVLNFTSTKVIATSLDPEEAGTVVGAGEYALGETCTLTATANEGFQFKNWTLNGEVVSTEPSYSFTVAEDADYVAHFHYVHTQALAAGWNWWSTYIEQEGIDGLEMLENSLGEAGVRIQGRDGFVDQFEYQGTSYWYGNLESIENGYMYKVRTNAECEAVMVSDLVSPTDHPVTISEGWNWFGFPCNQSQSLDEAMSGFVPEANDVVKGRNGASTFVSYGSSNMWYGTLHTLEPGQGYMYKSNSSTPKELTFLARRGGEVGEDVREGGFFTPNAADFASNMLVTAVIEMDGEELRSEEYELAAFVGDECRGSVKLMYVEALDRYVAFLLVFGDMQEEMDFALANGNDVVWSDNRLTYAVDGIEGTPTDPVILHFGTLGLDDNQRELVKVFPNPSNGIFNIEGNGSRKVEVLDACGQIVFSKETEDDCVQIDLSAKANGLYLLRVVSNNGVTTNRLIKK